MAMTEHEVLYLEHIQKSAELFESQTKASSRTIAKNDPIIFRHCNWIVAYLLNHVWLGLNKKSCIIDPRLHWFCD